MDLIAFRKLTRIDQTLFGLPFILDGAILACIAKKSWSIGFSCVWVLAAFIFARIAGMAFNQVIDRKSDARNPRTKDRVVASGKVSAFEAYSVAFSALAFFLFSCKMLHTKMVFFGLPIAFLIMIYSYCKRFTFLSHFVLGIIHFSGPMLAGFALYPHFSLPIFFLSLASFFLFTGSDILYALQDLAFDKKENLYSLPAKFSIPIALTVAAMLHAFSIISLFGVGIYAHLNPFFYLCPLFATVAFFCFHLQIKNVSLHHRAEPKIEPLFFSTNVGIACSSLLFLILGAI